MICDVYLSLGSNMGDRVGNLKAAVEALKQMEDTDLVKMSSVYETDPVGYTEQGRFLNLALKISTGLRPVELLEKLHEIEQELGRVRNLRWGPRTIDIDILLFADLEINSEKLQVPHPRMFERAFVLIPLKDIADGGTYSASEWDRLITGCGDKEGVKFFGNLESL